MADTNGMVNQYSRMLQFKAGPNDRCKHGISISMNCASCISESMTMELIKVTDKTKFKADHKDCHVRVWWMGNEQVELKCETHGEYIDLTVRRECCEPMLCMGGSCPRQPYSCNH